jgi:pilus assembly protein CpaF
VTDARRGSAPDGVVTADVRLKSLIPYYEALGPLRGLVLDDTLTEIMVTAPDRIYVERDGTILLTDCRFDDEAHLVRVIDFIAQAVGRRIDEESPLLDARLLDGSRVNAVVAPVAVDGPLLTIRKFSREPLCADDLVRLGAISVEGLTFLRASVAARANIVISGGTGSGKTTLLNTCSSFIPTSERIVTIEDAAELRLLQEHVCRLEARPADAGGRRQVTIRDLAVNALRMRPDRIVIGECRAGEALDMLQAMNTGHDGSLTTLHANSPRDALSRIETMVLMAGLDLPTKAIRQQVSAAIHLVVHLARLTDGTRRVVSIAEITGMEGDIIAMQDIFSFEFLGIEPHGRLQGSLRPTGIRPRLIDRFAARGVPISSDLARLFPMARPDADGSWQRIGARQ